MESADVNSKVSVSTYRLLSNRRILPRYCQQPSRLWTPQYAERLIRVKFPNHYVAIRRTIGLVFCVASCATLVVTIVPREAQSHLLQPVEGRLTGCQVGECSHLYSIAWFRRPLECVIGLNNCPRSWMISEHPSNFEKSLRFLQFLAQPVLNPLPAIYFTRTSCALVVIRIRA